MNEVDEYRCPRCSIIPWKRLVQCTPGSGVRLFDVTDTLQDLGDSACRLCRILGAAILSSYGHKFCTRASRTRQLEVSLQWWRTFRDTSIGELELEIETDESFTSIGDIQASCIMYQEDDPLLEGRSHWQYGPKRVDFPMVKRWIRDCVATHKECESSSGATLTGLKVLDCFSRSVVSAPKGCNFVALSYVWGDPGIYETPQFLDLSVTLPRTVEDSIEATKMLGYQYLWVDRYCIDQASAIHQHNQISQMGDIYSSAQVTIIAAAGTDSAFGIPGVTRNRETTQISTTVGRLCLGRSRVSIVDTIHQSVWASRAWTFQEGYLSKRRLYFSEHQLVYICDEQVHSDGPLHALTRSTSIDRQTLSSLGNSLPTRTVWQDPWKTATSMIKEYLRRDLTYDSDALNAIVGALNTLKEVDHIYGVPFTHYRHKRSQPSSQSMALHWIHTSPCPRRKEFPTWSPLGWNGAVEYLHEDFDGDALQDVATISCSLKVWHRDEYSELSGIQDRVSNAHTANPPGNLRFLKVSTTVVMLDFEYLDQPICGGWSKSGLYVRVPYNQNTEFFIHPYWDIGVEQVSLDHQKQLPCAVIVRTDEGTARFERKPMILILQQHDDYYERIGCFRLEDSRSFSQANPGDSFSNEQTRCLDIDSDDLYWMRDGEERTFLLG